MAKASPKKLEEIVQPIIVVDGEKEHALKALFRSDKAPIIKSIGYTTVPGLEGIGRHVAYVITSQGDKVLNVEVTLPNMLGVAVEAAKTWFVTELEGEER